MATESGNLHLVIFRAGLEQVVIGLFQGAGVDVSSIISFFKVNFNFSE